MISIALNQGQVSLTTSGSVPAAIAAARMDAPLLSPDGRNYFLYEASESDLNQLDELDWINVQILRRNLVRGESPSRVFKQNDYAITWSLPYILTGDEEYLLTLD